ncbi:transglutaminase family protein [Dyadobacter arcticus]|uniref:Transglutaminase-like putative cysteine protease n=1 Tax=Dyadobacter arcticus TaxID=1078754 RepID=A0ABX0UIP6_9BACT|nr:transglutaminase family protein [Dyadobacter arcticus]NIJ51081.1 transglutaminase-like putative cysteine protease [Dyadobacter arcticus]
MRYKLIHKTEYKYAQAVNNYHSLLCLTPRTLNNQFCKDFSIEITPEPSQIIKRTDFYGNTTHYFSLHSPHKDLTVLTKGMVERVSESTGSLFMPSDITCAEVRQRQRNDRTLKIALLEYLLPSPSVKWDLEIINYAQDCFQDNRPLYECVQALCRKIYKEFDFVPDFTTVNTPIKEVLHARKGVCQDFSHLAIACVRSYGFAARYVSGYLETLPPPGRPKLQGSDASHAWISVFIPDYGWCDFDPTNNIIPGERHIVTAWGRDYSDVPPLKGIIFSYGKHTLKVEVDVIPV